MVKANMLQSLEALAIILIYLIQHTHTQRLEFTDA